ncbi:hypothetical protein C8J56DRAFT_867455, partial [Mycena floridula]
MFLHASEIPLFILIAGNRYLKTGFRSRGYVPANSSVFHGLVALVKLLTVSFVGSKLARLCLLRPGGMGKTSVALEIMAQPELAAFFSKKNCLWLACVQATSVSLFLDMLCVSLGILDHSGDNLSAILSELGKPEPIVLLLDNFETPWNSSGERAEIAQILRDIEAIPNVALFVTMRGSEAPVEGIRWHSEFITPLDLEASLQIFADISPEGRGDPELPNLLNEVGNMPLAVTLLARLANSTQCTAGEMLKKYKSRGTAILGRGLDAQYSMDVCISLSVESQPMKECQEALMLLFILGRLPAGTTYEMLEQWWARNITDLLVALDTLRATALIEARNRSFFVLPVIRSYLLDHSRFPDAVTSSMIGTACHFLQKYHITKLNDHPFREHQDTRLLEELNLQSVLLTSTSAEDIIIEALITLAEHQSRTRPRTEVIEHAIQVAKKSPNHRKLLGQALYSPGKMLGLLHRDQESIEQYALARETFLAISEREMAAYALLGLAHTGHTNRLALLEQAQNEFESLGNNPNDIAFCLFHLGRAHHLQKDNTKAVELLVRASGLFKECSWPAHAVKCASYLARSYHSMGEYDEAELWGLRALKEGQQLGYQISY